MTTPLPDGVSIPVLRDDVRFTIRDLAKNIITDRRESEESILRAALAEAYQLGVEAGFEAQKEFANGFPQA